MSRRPLQHVVFDWNGTLIDDCALAVATVNALRVERGMAEITKDQYRRAFRFPISAFYRDLGFEVDDQGFSALMARYLALFNAGVDDCPLHPGARETIAQLRAAGVGVHILSASHQDTLRRSLEAKGLTADFDEVAGMSHELATGKHEIGAALARRLSADPESVLYVGDTDHDHEVAAALRFRFLFIDHGHQVAVREAPHCAHTITELRQSLSYLSP